MGHAEFGFDVDLRTSSTRGSGAYLDVIKFHTVSIAGPGCCLAECTIPIIVLVTATGSSAPHCVLDGTSLYMAVTVSGSGCNARGGVCGPQAMLAATDKVSIRDTETGFGKQWPGMLLCDGVRGGACECGG